MIRHNHLLQEKISFFALAAVQFKYLVCAKSKLLGFFLASDIQTATESITVFAVVIVTLHILILVQILVLKEPVFERKALFFPLTPFLEIEVHVGALQKEWGNLADVSRKRTSLQTVKITCSYSSLMIFGSSCL